jgi:hypothetical protein
MPTLHYSRPQIIRNYAKQKEFIDCPTRYTVIEACTKSGKTTGCIVWLFEQSLRGKVGDNYWWVAPVFDVSKIAFRRFKRYISDKRIISKINETELTITLITGVVIAFKSADKPDSLYGDDVKAVVLDEATRMKEEAWHAVRSTLTKTEGLCKIIGNTKGIMNWVYQLITKIEKKELEPTAWTHFKITADDAVAAGVLKAEEIEDARKTLPNGVFLELYYCIPNQNSSRKFCYSFDESRHVARCPDWNRSQITYLSFDFNKNPICCNVIQHYGGHIYVLESIKLENSDIYRLCEVIKIKYPGAIFAVCGDASGSNKSAMVQDDQNYFLIIKKQLRLSIAQMQQLTSNPGIEENQVLVNAILEKYNVTMDIDKAQPLIFDCKFVEMDASGKIKKGDREDPAQQADSLDCFRYYLNRYHHAFIKRYTDAMKS